MRLSILLLAIIAVIFIALTATCVDANKESTVKEIEPLDDGKKLSPNEQKRQELRAFLLSQIHDCEGSDCDSLKQHIEEILSQDQYLNGQREFNEVSSEEKPPSHDEL